MGKGMAEAATLLHSTPCYVQPCISTAARKLLLSQSGDSNRWRRRKIYREPHAPPDLNTAGKPGWAAPLRSMLNRISIADPCGHIPSSP